MLDIVKVRLQTSPQYRSALDCGRKILTQEGPLAFYKGTVTPLIGIGACVSVQFGAFHYARRQLEAYNRRHFSAAARASPKLPSPSQPLTFTQYYFCGAFAGLTNSLLSGPIEHVRIRLQTQPHDSRSRLYQGPWDCIRKLSSPARTDGAHGTGAEGGGILRGLYRGQSVTFLREAQAYGVWFLTFEYLMNLDMRRNSYTRDQISSVKLAFYGGLAGEALWISSYPFDVVKSKMQSDGFAAASSTSSSSQSSRPPAGPIYPAQRYSSMRDCFNQTWREEGMRGFWRGIGPTLIRALPVSAGTFAVVELIMRALG